MTIETRPENQEGKNKVLGFFGKSKKRVAAAAGAVVLAIALVAGACAGNGNSEPADTGGEVPERAEGTEGTEGTERAEGTEGTEGPERAEGTEGTEGTERAEGTEGTEGTERAEGTEGAGHESGAEGTNEGPEGTEGTESSGQASGQAAGQGQGTYLASTGVSRGVKSTQVLDVGDSYAGKLNDLELAITYDDQNDRFVARVKNEAAVGICDTSVKVVTDGQPGPQSLLIPALDVGGRADFTLEAPQTPFNSWQAQTETFTCTATPSHPGEGGEAGGGESGSEGGGESGGEGPGHESGGSEGGGEGSGAESGEETSPATPVNQPVTGTFNNLDYRVAYDRAANAFRATVTNNTNQTVCSSRLEIHMGAQGQVIELGPTIGVDLQPGESIDVVLSAAPVIPDTYSIHPESSPCP